MGFQNDSADKEICAILKLTPLYDVKISDI